MAGIKSVFNKLEPLMTKLVQFNGCMLVSFFFDQHEVQVNKISQYPSILTSHLVNNAVSTKLNVQKKNSEP